VEPKKALRHLRLICSACRLELDGRDTSERTCSVCDRRWVLTKGKWWFAGEDRVVTYEATDSWKSVVKNYPRVYAFASNVLSPVYPHWFLEARRLRRRLSDGDLVIDVGSGNQRLGESVVNVDLMPYPNVDVVTEADQLPFADESVDVLISIAMIEHVLDPAAVLSECHRVLKVGATAYIYVPFIQGFHAAPHDYQRLTRPGLLHALRHFDIERTENFGPTSGLIWILAEWLSIVLSFGFSHVQRILALIFTVILSPLKFIDVILRHFPGAENISTGFLVVARKPSPMAEDCA